MKKMIILNISAMLLIIIINTAFFLYKISLVSISLIIIYFFVQKILLDGLIKQHKMLFGVINEHDVTKQAKSFFKFFWGIYSYQATPFILSLVSNDNIFNSFACSIISLGAMYSYVKSAISDAPVRNPISGEYVYYNHTSISFKINIYLDYVISYVIGFFGILIINHIVTPR